MLPAQWTRIVLQCRDSLRNISTFWRLRRTQSYSSGSDRKCMDDGIRKRFPMFTSFRLAIIIVCLYTVAIHFQVSTTFLSNCTSCFLFLYFWRWNYNAFGYTTTLAMRFPSTSLTILSLSAICVWLTAQQWLPQADYILLCIINSNGYWILSYRHIL